MTVSLSDLDLGLKGKATPETFWSTSVLAALLAVVGLSLTVGSTSVLLELNHPIVFSDHAVSTSSLCSNAQVYTFLSLIKVCGRSI